VKLVIDASVTLKWLLPDAAKEQDVDRAQALLAEVERGEHELVQPPHWATEVLAVMARQAPDSFPMALEFLRRIKYEGVSDDAAYLRGGKLAIQNKQHLFDALYHAIALVRGAMLITADERYYRAAEGEGSIVLLSDFKIS
jgi:predicted nucleic acid-binding protein